MPRSSYEIHLLCGAMWRASLSLGECARSLRRLGYTVLKHFPARPNEEMNANKLLSTERDAILRIGTKYGARNIRIFGSFARGEADSASDLDFLVDLEPGRSLLDLGGLQMELESLLGCRVDVATERGLKARIRDRVLSEAVPV